MAKRRFGPTLVLKGLAECEVQMELVLVTKVRRFKRGFHRGDVGILGTNGLEVCGLHHASPIAGSMPIARR